MRYLPLAGADLEAIDAYLSDFYPGTAGRFFADLKEKLLLLQETPEMGAVYRQYRRLIVGQYLVFYVVNQEAACVDIYRIIRGTSDIGRQLNVDPRL